VPRIIEHSLPRRPLQQAAERLLAAVDESPAPLTAAQPGSAPASEGDSAAPASPLPAADVEDFQAVVAYLRPSLAARGLSLAQALGFLLEEREG
jgi:predicted nucleic acid-binding Zn ribbon protein